MNFEIIKYKTQLFELEINVSENEQSVWLTKDQMATLYDRDRSVISRHINKILKENGLDLTRVCAKNARTGSDGKTYQSDYYNIDVILAVGNRVKSNNGKLLKAFTDSYFASKNQNIIVYNNDDISLDVRIEPQSDTVWLNVNQIALLFDTTKENIYIHIKNIYEEGELEDSVTKDFLVTQKEIVQTAADGKSYMTTIYNLDVILAVGYRVKSKNAIKFRRWATRVLKEYLLKGYVVEENRTLVTEQNYLNLLNKIDSLEKRLQNVESYSIIQDKIIYEHQWYDALVIISQLIESATKSIVLIDPYLDVKTLNAFKNKPKSVSFRIITCKKNNKLSQMDVSNFQKQYGSIAIRYNNSYHDRYLIIDNQLFYHLGSSVNYLGKRFSQITLIKDDDIIGTLRKRANE